MHQAGRGESVDTREEQNIASAASRVHSKGNPRVLLSSSPLLFLLSGQLVPSPFYSEKKLLLPLVLIVYFYFVLLVP